LGNSGAMEQKIDWVFRRLNARYLFRCSRLPKLENLLLTFCHSEIPLIVRTPATLAAYAVNFATFLPACDFSGLISLGDLTLCDEDV
jgi:hypothetical protein